MMLQAMTFLILIMTKLMQNLNLINPALIKIRALTVQRKKQKLLITQQMMQLMRSLLMFQKLIILHGIFLLME